SIFKIDKTRDDNILCDITVYTIYGEHDALENDRPILVDDYEDVIKGISRVQNNDNAYAKKVKIGDRVKFYIKQNNSGHFFNPMGITKNKSVVYNHPELSFREVKSSAFSLYIKFLRTKNTSLIA